MGEYLEVRRSRARGLSGSAFRVHGSRGLLPRVKVRPREPVGFPGRRLPRLLLHTAEMTVEKLQDSPLVGGAGQSQGAVVLGPLDQPELFPAGGPRVQR